MADATLSEAVKKQRAAEALAAADDEGDSEDTQDTSDTQDDAETAAADTGTDTGDTESKPTTAEEEVTAASEVAAPAERPNLGYTFTPVTAPAAQAPRPAAAQDVSSGTSQYFLNPATGSYEEQVYTDPDTGGRYVVDQASGQMVPRAELATVADKAAQPPGGVNLPRQIVAGQAPVQEAPDTLTQVERGELVKLPSGAALQAQPVTAPAQAAPVTQPQVQHGYTFTPIGQGAKPIPDYVPGTSRPELIPGYVPGTSRTVPLSADLAQGPPGTHPAGTSDEPYWPKTPEQVKQLPPGSVYIDPQDQSVKTTPGQPTAAKTAQPPVQAPQVAGIKPLTAAEAQEPPIDAYSNGYTPGRGNQSIRNVILHSTDGTEKSDIPTLTQSGKVGVQYYVTKDGRVMHFVNDADSAWQAGKDKYGGNANPYTIGIEQEHVDGKEAWPDAQVQATAKVAAGILLRNPNLTLSDVVGHSDIAGERKQDPVNYPWDKFRTYVQAYMGQGAPVTPAAPQAQPATKQANGFYQNEKPTDFLTGKATTFATPDDIASGQDNGVGAPRLGKLDTTSVMGLAVPEEALRAKYGNNYAAWRTARVDVVDSQTGKRLRVPIVDLGPRGDLSAIVDMTPSLSQYFGGDKNLSVKLVDHAGPDVTKNPQLFADEQAALKQGFDSSALAPGVAKVRPQLGYSFKATGQSISQAQIEQNMRAVVGKLPEADSGNIIGLYKRLDQPVQGVSDSVRTTIQTSLKPQIVSLMQQKFPELNANDAWAKATSDVNPLDVGREWLSKAIGYGQQFTNVLQKGVAGTDQLHVNQFLDSAMPGASDADKHAYLSKLYAMPIEQQIAEISSKLPQPQTGIPSTDPQQIVSALTRLSDPNFQKQQAADLAKAKAEMQRNLADDPRLTATGVGKIVNATAQMPAFIAAFANPVLRPLVLAQISDQVHDELKAEHPDWDDKTLQENTAHVTLAQYFGQEAANAIFIHGVGPVLQGIESPAKRAIATALSGAGAPAVIAGGTQAATNILTGEPIQKGVGEAALTGGIQGVVPGLIHGAGELRRPTEQAMTAPAPPPPVIEASPPRPQPVRAADVLGPNVPDVSVPWYQPGPIVTRATERTAFTPEELRARVAELQDQGYTPAQLQQVIDKLQPEPDYNQRSVALADQAAQIEIQGAQQAQAQPTTPAEPMPFQSPQAVNESEPWVSRIANRFTAERIINGEVGPVQPGQGVTTEEMLARGMKMGPEEINQHVSNVMNDAGGNPRLQAAAIRTEEARLSQRSRDASIMAEANPQNRQAQIDADNAFKDLTDFHNGPVAKLKNNWHAQGMTLQGEVPVDLSTFNGLREAFLKDVGKPPGAELEPVLRKTAQSVRDASTDEAGAMQKLGAEIERQTAKRVLPSADAVRDKIMARMKVEPCPM